MLRFFLVPLLLLSSLPSGLKAFCAPGKPGSLGAVVTNGLG